MCTALLNLAIYSEKQALSHFICTPPVTYFSIKCFSDCINLSRIVRGLWKINEDLASLGNNLQWAEQYPISIILSPESFGLLWWTGFQDHFKVWAKSVVKFKKKTLLVSVDWPSGVSFTAFNQKGRTAIILEKIFCVFWWSVNYVAFSLARLIAFLRIRQR